MAEGRRFLAELARVVYFVQHWVVPIARMVLAQVGWEVQNLIQSFAAQTHCHSAVAVPKAAHLFAVRVEEFAVATGQSRQAGCPALFVDS